MAHNPPNRWLVVRRDYLRTLWIGLVVAALLALALYMSWPLLAGGEARDVHWLAGASMLTTVLLAGLLAARHKSRTPAWEHPIDRPAWDGDRVGLTLSGGGMRSGTLGLGLLRALRDGGAFERVRVLATVSGGGYAGGLWSTLHRGEGVADGPWRRGVRSQGHLLAPRVGLFEADTWVLISAIMSALLLGLLAAAPLFLAAFMAWAALLTGCMELHPGAIVFALTWASLLLAALARSPGKTSFSAALAAGSIAVLAGLAMEGILLVGGAAPPEIAAYGWRLPMAWAAVYAFLVLFGQLRAVDDRSHIWVLLDLLAARLLAFAAAGFCAWLAWISADWLESAGGRNALGGIAASAVSIIVTQVLGSSPEDQPEPSGFKRSVLELLPSYVALAAFAVASCLVIQVVFRHAPGAWAIFVGAWILAVLVLWFPNRTALHGFYSRRIQSTWVDPARHRDDKPAGLAPRLQALADSPGPEHVLLCAANNLGAPNTAAASTAAHLVTLSAKGLEVIYAGSNGRAVPRRTAPLGLAEAMATSGAAIDSGMGAYSRRLGWASSVAMAVLNLRLGRWLPSLDIDVERVPLRYALFPGALYYRELLGMARADGAFVRLSDGGHFDHLGLYELVRRRCSAIVCLDASPDPDNRFSELSRTVHRILSDGLAAAIELDTDDPSHLAVGRVHYGDGHEAPLIYCKPIVHGDAPLLVRTYASRVPGFPHESSVDQFYDAEQFDAYETLGYDLGAHAAEALASYAPA